MHPEVIVDPCLEIKIAVKKMRRIMGWKKTIDVGIDIDKIEASLGVKELGPSVPWHLQPTCAVTGKHCT